MAMKSNFEWEKWGEKDPLYAVATWEGKQRGQASAWTDVEFYELGRSDWADFHRAWKDYGINEGQCLEIGCGAGRITRQLSHTFSKVIAADVSSHQLDYARQHSGATNVDYLLIDGLHYPVPDGSCDGVFSVHVFQHFESLDDAYAVFAEVFRVLKKSGSFLIHLPLFTLPDMKIAGAIRPLLALSKRLSDVKAAIDRRAMARGTGSGVMRRLRFERHDLVTALKSIGFEDLEFRCITVRSNGSLHDLVMARKPA